MKRALIGIFFSSDTGNTEKLAKTIQMKLGKNVSDIFDVAYCSKEDMESYNNLLLGVPTWYYGEPQCDWDVFLPVFKEIDFSEKKVAIFGCGDQEDYSEYFCDAMSILHTIAKNNGAKIVGEWPTSGYHFDTSKSIINNKFIGLAIDEDRQPELTEIRVQKWINQIQSEMDLH